MSSSVFSGDSDFQESSNTLSYMSRTGQDAGLISDINLSTALGSPEFGRRPHNLDSGLGLRPQDTGVIFSPTSTVCSIVPILLRRCSNPVKHLGRPQPGPFFSPPAYDASSIYIREECMRLRRENDQMNAYIHTSR